MFLSHRILVPFLLLSFSTLFFAQTDSSYIGTEESLEDIIQEPAEQTDDSNLYEILEQLKQNPVDLNSASVSELQQIPGVDLHTAETIVKHRKKYGYFFGPQELNAIPGLPKEIINNMMPFVTTVQRKQKEIIQQPTENKVSEILGNTKVILRSRFSNDLQTRKGFLQDKFIGSKPKVYNRFYLKYLSNFQFGYIAEKDAGESSLDEFYSLHFAVRDLGILKNLVLSDYLVEFGQGLALWSPYGFSKGADAIYPVKRKGRIVRPYTSATEVNFLRGVAASVKVNDFIITGFYSKNKFDANIDSLTGEIISTPVSGFHRTSSEISKKNTAEEKMIGARLDYTFSDFLSAGLLYYKSDFSNSFLPQTVFDFSGNSFNYSSFYYDLILSSINIFGEIAYNGTSVASINSVQIAVNRNFAFTTSVRSYPRNYLSLHGHAFGERNGATTNEFGIYTGLRWRTVVGVLNFYYDQFKFPFATFNNPLPSDGDEFLADLTSRPLYHVETRIRYKYENKDIRIPLDNTKKLVKRLRQVIRFELIYNLSRQIRLKGRFEFNDYRVSQTGANENGYLFFQDIRFTPNSSFNFYGRIVFFRTDSFNSAIYEYENDLTGILTNRALFGEGIRWYLILRYRPLRFITISAKYSETYKPKERAISSGINEINGNLDNRVSLQIDFHL